MATTTKSDIAAAVLAELGGQQRESIAIVEAVLEIIKGRLEQGEEVKLSKFGNFVVKEKSARPARNPKTGEAAKVSARKVVTFRASELLRERVKIIQRKPD